MSKELAPRVMNQATPSWTIVILRIRSRPDDGATTLIGMEIVSPGYTGAGRRVRSPSMESILPPSNHLYDTLTGAFPRLDQTSSPTFLMVTSKKAVDPRIISRWRTLDSICCIKD